MNKIYDRGLYFLSLITLCLNPFELNKQEEGIEVDLGYYRLIINGGITKTIDNKHYFSKLKKGFIRTNFDKKLSFMTTVYDKYGEVGRTFFEKYIPNNKCYIFEENNFNEILDFILDSDNKIKNITNYNIQYESSQLRCTKEMETRINEFLYESLNECKKRKNLVKQM